MYKKVSPNKALIVTGISRKVVVGGGTVVIPFLHKAQEFSLEPRIINVNSRRIISKDKVPLSIKAVATAKIDDSSTESILKAAQKFMDKIELEINEYLREIIESHLTTVISKTKFREIVENSNSLMEQVLISAQKDLSKDGFQIRSLTVKHINVPYELQDIALGKTVNIEINQKYNTKDQKELKIEIQLSIKYNGEDFSIFLGNYKENIEKIILNLMIEFLKRVEYLQIIENKIEVENEIKNAIKTILNSKSVDIVTISVVIE
ncbi:MAG: flotillin family protein [Candidatus Calescibacterium sp.]|nr:flotillin family protein [Candidatus Calescibacterium sp.]MDW8133409.1 flotillin family protein [Candidatus Calescibacterium sp.]